MGQGEGISLRETPPGPRSPGQRPPETPLDRDPYLDRDPPGQRPAGQRPTETPLWTETPIRTETPVDRDPLDRDPLDRDPRTPQTEIPPWTENPPYGKERAVRILLECSC